VHRDHRDSQASHRTRSASSSRHRHAGRVHREKLENQDRKDHPAIQAHPDHQAIPAETEVQEAQDRKARPAHQEIQDLMDPVVTQVHQLLALQQHPEIQDQRDQTDHQATLEIQDRKETTALPAIPDPKARPDQTVDPAKMAPQETKDHPAQMDHQENVVSARNTAPSTVVSSSKTAHGVKRRIARNERRQLWTNTASSKAIQMDMANVFSYSLLILHCFLLFPTPQQRQPQDNHVEFRFFHIVQNAAIKFVDDSTMFC